MPAKLPAALIFLAWPRRGIMKAPWTEEFAMADRRIAATPAQRLVTSLCCWWVVCLGGCDTPARDAGSERQLSRSNEERQSASQPAAALEEGPPPTGDATDDDQISAPTAGHSQQQRRRELVAALLERAWQRPHARDSTTPSLANSRGDAPRRSRQTTS